MGLNWAVVGHEQQCSDKRAPHRRTIWRFKYFVLKLQWWKSSSAQRKAHLSQHSFTCFLFAWWFIPKTACLCVCTEELMHRGLLLSQMRDRLSPFSSFGFFVDSRLQSSSFMSGCLTFVSSPSTLFLHLGTRVFLYEYDLINGMDSLCPLGLSTLIEQSCGYFCLLVLHNLKATDSVFFVFPNVSK